MKISHYFLRVLLSAVLTLSAIVLPVQAINSGVKAAPGRWSSVVALVRAGLDNTTGFYCAGSLIAPGWVVTAAHCVSGVSPGYLEVVSGLYSLSLPGNSQRISVVQIIVHPDYHLPTLTADIALIKLAKDSTAPVLPVMAESGALTGMLASMLGWGYLTQTGPNPDKLQQAMAAIVSQQACSQAYQGVQAIYDSMICAGDGIGGPSLCAQDSGGPLLLSIGGQDVLAGVASFNIGCGSTGYYSGFSRISSQFEFLRQHVSGLKLFAREPAFSPSPLIYLLLGMN